MEDEKIVELFWQRNENALHETERKYGGYLAKIAMNLLSNSEDCKESINDVYLKAWNSMPPHRPDLLAAYLAKITRQLSIDRLRTRERKKRGGLEYDLSLEELGECVSGSNSIEAQVEGHLLAEAIEAYLHTLSPQARNLFIGRYFYLDSVEEVAAYYGFSLSKTKSMLHRTRIGLKKYLEQEGFDV